VGCVVPPAGWDGVTAGPLDGSHVGAIKWRYRIFGYLSAKNTGFKVSSKRGGYINSC